MNQIEHTARGLAGEFWEQKRSDRFRSKNSLTRAKALHKFPDGTLREVTVVVPFRTAYPDAETFAAGHWPLFVEAARQCLVAMLAMPDSKISPDDKEHIAAALIEDKRRRDTAGGGRILQQRKPEPWHADQLLRGFK